LNHCYFPSTGLHIEGPSLQRLFSDLQNHIRAARSLIFGVSEIIALSQAAVSIEKKKYKAKNKGMLQLAPFCEVKPVQSLAPRHGEQLLGFDTSCTHTLIAAESYYCLRSHHHNQFPDLAIWQFDHSNKCLDLEASDTARNPGLTFVIQILYISLLHFSDSLGALSHSLRPWFVVNLYRVSLELPRGLGPRSVTLNLPL